MPKLHPSIIRAYDIRGIYEETLKAEDAYIIGKSFASFLDKNATIIIGFDGRVSSPILIKELSRGLRNAGVKVINIGLCPTPMLYFSVYHLNADAGIMVTGSHNPKNHNGFKMMLGKDSFFGEQIIDLSKRAEKISYEVDDVNEGEKKINIQADYLQRILQNFSLQKDIKIAWDPGNGASGNVVEEVAELLQAKDMGQHFVINAEVDGTFPNHHPDPTVPENLTQLIELVKKENCDLGIAFDGDGDRIGAVDRNGKIINGYELMVLFARDVIHHCESQDLPKIVADVKSSEILFKDIELQGGKPIMWKTGHSFIKTKMKEENAKLAGEMSGHIFFADEYYGYDDAIYAALRLLRIANRENIQKIFASLPKIFSSPEMRIFCADDQKFAIVDSIKASLTKKDVAYDDIDGLRVSSADGWWLVRASNTQAALIVCFEAYTKERFEQIKKHLSEILAEHNLKI